MRTFLTQICRLILSLMYDLFDNGRCVWCISITGTFKLLLSIVGRGPCVRPFVLMSPLNYELRDDGRYAIDRR